MTGPPSDVLQRQKKDRLPMALGRLRGYSDNLLDVVRWCMAMDPLARPQSVFALHKALSQASRRYTPCRWPRKCGCSWKRC
jgi:hypothetical protein